MSADAKTYTFHLRKGVQFANLPPVSGRALTAADVVWSFDYWSRTGQFKDAKLQPSFLAPRFEGVEKIEAPDPSTVVVRFKDPFVPFLTYAALDWLPVVPHEIYNLDGHLKNRIAGTGPFQLDVAASQKGSRWSWKKNPTYWDEGKPYLDEVRWLVIPDDSTMKAAFVAKQLSWIPIPDAKSADEVQRAVPDAVAHEFEAVVGGCTYLNQKAPPFNILEVRKAFSLAIDRDEISQVFYGKKQPVAAAGALAGLFTDAEARQLSRYDPGEAKRLLAQAGFANGVDIEWQERSSAPNKENELVQAQAKKAGINISLKMLDLAEQTQNRKVGNYQMQFVGANCGNLTDEHDALYLIYHSKSAINLSGTNDPDLDKLLVAQRQETNAEKRREIQRQAVKVIADKAYTISWVYPPKWEFWPRALKGHAPNSQVPYPGFGNAWLDK